MAHLQIRNVPDDLHRKLKERAASLGMSLSDYLLRELNEMAGRPTMEQWLERLSRQEPVNPGVSIAELIREDRDSH